jgi:hypothetical protein
MRKFKPTTKATDTTNRGGNAYRRGKLMLLVVAVLLALLLLASAYYGVVQFFTNYRVQSPVVFRPVVVKREPVKKSQKAHKKITKKSHLIPQVEASEKEIESWPKYLSEQGSINREWVLNYLKDKYFGNDLIAMDNLFKAESAYDPTVINYAGAGGLCQALPHTKMGCPLEQTEEAMACQVNWCTIYSENRYGSPLEAWNFWLAEVPIDGVSFGHWF